MCGSNDSPSQCYHRGNAGPYLNLAGGLVGLVPQLAEQFRAQNPGINFQIAAEGSSTGISALFDNTAKLAMSSRDVTPVEISSGKEKGVVFHPIIVAYDGMAVIVNSANPVNNLTKKQVEQIFVGDITDWSAVGGNPGKISIYAILLRELIRSFKRWRCVNATMQ